jgi:hypothetical protein|tara:strand:+ start:7362 stop:7763 length:402 start_codon:yes stop_codon:yes gene_type:complete
MKVSIGNYPVYRWYHHIGLIKFQEEPKVKVRIDPWDTHSMDITLSHVILPMLIQLQRKQHIVPRIEQEDLPEGISQSEDVWDASEAAWNWALGEMIYAFNAKLGEEFLPHQEEAERVSNGFRLFGKYYNNLWD